MLYTREVRTLAAKIRHYEGMAKLRLDSTAGLAPAHYGLANQIKAVRLYDLAMQFIRACFPRNEVRIVDVGCAGGLFLLGAQVAENAYNCGTPSRFVVRGIAVDPQEKRDTERYVGCPVADPKTAEIEWSGWADVITLFNVLEHVNNPYEFLELIKRVLRPGGMIVIDVPNNFVLELRSRIMGRWPDLDLGEHINHFVPTTLDSLMKRAGFRPITRLPGILHGVDSFGQALNARQVLRWLGSRILMILTRGKIQTFSHMTMAYRRN